MGVICKYNNKKTVQNKQIRQVKQLKSMKWKKIEVMIVFIQPSLCERNIGLNQTTNKTSKPNQLKQYNQHLQLKNITTVKKCHRNHGGPCRVASVILLKYPKL
ncbi:uncharacterized protein ASCRUDRAFT_81461 [Ascoidea rubescens DSM 1968]|uniref:Uncharacterized protein n=1 Tax=Ascoidea rubescens DSM 1968 TaxID=1344418 RepID=A0A1D2VFY1_9ASCO|nr:hypothetical protein ASCRUDRAFT_81461 [Ascoidea rubescens DSM 1968]ODV60535.1 hypothetical protein ASCRUDRAFT_81461 [Ascoidea rubescens DSM 1968]